VERTLKDCIGERLLAFTEPWDGDCEAEDMILEFESGAFRVIAVDHSEPGLGGCPSLVIDEIKRGD